MVVLEAIRHLGEPTAFVFLLVLYQFARETASFAGRSPETVQVARNETEADQVKGLIRYEAVGKIPQDASSIDAKATVPKEKPRRTKVKARSHTMGQSQPSDSPARSKGSRRCKGNRRFCRCHGCVRSSTLPRSPRSWAANCPYWRAGRF
jgi:hypothetical protein